MNKGNRAARAQLFQSFDALAGFRDLLAQQEKVIVPPRVLSEDEREQLDVTLAQVRVGDVLRVVFQSEDVFVEVTGMVSRFCLEERRIDIVKRKIDLLKVVEMEIMEKSRIENETEPIL